jgi:hypothetical protein
MQNSNNGCRYILCPAAPPLAAVYCNVPTQRRRMRDDDGNVVVKWETFCRQHQLDILEESEEQDDC